MPVVSRTVTSGACSASSGSTGRIDDGLADAGGVQPDQPARRAWGGIDAAALGRRPGTSLPRRCRRRSITRSPGAAIVAATAHAAA